MDYITYIDTYIDKYRDFITLYIDIIKLSKRVQIYIYIYKDDIILHMFINTGLNIRIFVSVKYVGLESPESMTGRESSDNE